MPKDEYSLGNVFKKEANIFAEYTGLYGFVAKSAYQGLFPNTRVLRPAEDKNPRARARPRPSFVMGVSFLLRSLTSSTWAGLKWWLSVLPKTKSSRTRDRPEPHHDPGLPLPRSALSI